MSASCASCPTPGMCCKNIILNIRKDTTLEAILSVVSYWPEQNSLPLPFVNARRDDYGVVVDCEWLDADGRCGNYEHRPHYPCRSFEIGSDSLCAYGVSAFGLCPELPHKTRFIPTQAVLYKVLHQEWPFNFKLERK